MGLWERGKRGGNEEGDDGMMGKGDGGAKGVVKELGRVVYRCTVQARHLQCRGDDGDDDEESGGSGIDDVGGFERTAVCAMSMSMRWF